MGMNVGSSGGSDEPQVMGEMNTTPLIDVMLVLLVMLIITIPVQLHSINLNLPVGAAPPSVEEKPKVEIVIDKDSKVWWDGQEIASTDWEAKMLALKNSPSGARTEVHVKTDRLARYDVFASVMSSLARSGLTNLAVQGAQP